ncbi:unnamed protein product [Darwinula stevensoni]|uniref:Uncharacterized protein n=1 Tax=Darwinula stevensoni TaxID=69355 RepID=A0A7R8XH81_9CRUS|nr:unnamed protein product [Darwinula stevensoni]CAG0893269.1 unnamed protein product [Darwinula stevensoni]
MPRELKSFSSTDTLKDDAGHRHKIRVFDSQICQIVNSNPNRHCESAQIHSIVTGMAIVLLFASQCLGLTPYNCRYVVEDNGVPADCAANEVLFPFSMLATQACGAGGVIGSCNGQATSVYCCRVMEGTLSSSDCHTVGADSGEMAECGPLQFMQGACSSYFGESCGEFSHSVFCCNYYMNGFRLLPDNIEEERSSGGHHVYCPTEKFASGMCATSGTSAECTSNDFATLQCANPAYFKNPHFRHIKAVEEQ